MKEKMLGQIILELVKVPTGALGTLLDLLRRIIHPQTGEQFIGDLKAWLRGSKELVSTKILNWIGSVKTSVTTEKFVAKDKFKLKQEGGICSLLSDKFVLWFLVDGGKIEGLITDGELQYYKLTKNAVDSQIIEELGGEMKARTSLAKMFDLMMKQFDGEREGVLLTNGWANIFYINDISGVLRAVFLQWSGSGWNVDAKHVNGQCEWYDGRRVFSRDS